MFISTLCRRASIACLSVFVACVPAAQPDVLDAGPDIVSDAGPPDEYDPCDPSNRPDANRRPSWDAEPDAPLPNLIPVIQQPQIQNRAFGTGSCEVTEGCTVPGNRRLLRFDLLTPNIGQGDLYIGAPDIANRPPGQFEFGVCHNHWHFRGYADYRLFNAAGTEVGLGHKQSFCLEDSLRWMGMGRSLCPGESFRCSNQGIHAGYYDLYPRSLDCQYVDVTDVAPGTYTLRVAINTEHTLSESDFTDNTTMVTVEIPAVGADAGVSMNPTDACDSSVTGAERDCGWVGESSRACVAGTMVTVGCAAACTPAVGDCVADPIIRVCPDDTPCNHARALAENDDSCSSQCPSVTFVCPARARYNIMTGSHIAGGAYECRVVAR